MYLKYISQIFYNDESSLDMTSYYFVHQGTRNISMIRNVWTGTTTDRLAP